ncbi:hypothetical protein HZB78_02930 [Candidatus Collierbacteria bacterium]|nr:hypothetical protein [Candidatus Collierbacteria bacterium]
MIVHFSTGFKKQHQRLPLSQQKKFAKQLAYLMADPRHPSLRSHKMSGAGKFESRIDCHYRFTYIINDNMV